MKKIKLLIVDDEPFILEEASEALEFEGYDPLTASNVADALKIARDNPDIALILTDLKMPGQSGLDLVEILKQEFNNKLCFIVMSGHGSSDIEDSATMQGFSFIRKPLDIDELTEIIKFRLEN
jgi:DNA-binding NtrC family response regulator